VKSLETGPAKFLEAARLRSELVNLPRLGVDGNHYFGSFQLNIARAARHDAPETLSQDMSDFAGKHMDGGDHPAYYTNMLALSDLPPDYHPGVFIFYDLGAYVRMDGITSVNFTGLRFHGGTPATAPPGANPLNWPYRLTHISYPPTRIMDMSARQALATLPGGSTMYVTPEMQEHLVPQTAFQVPSKNANTILDGVGLMSRDEHLRWTVYNLFRVSLANIILCLEPHLITSRSIQSSLLIDYEREPTLHIYQST
jgi:hypothetical protein